MRRPRETKIDDLKAELVRAKEKAGEWQARVRDIERQITEPCVDNRDAAKKQQNKITQF